MSTETYNWREFLENLLNGNGLFGGVIADIRAAVFNLARWFDNENTIKIDATKLNEIVHQGALRATLVLPAQLALIKPISLPASAHKHLSNIVENKIRQLTPFEPKDVYFGYERLGSQGKEFKIRLIAAPKQICEPYMNTAKERQIAIDGLIVDGAQSVNILPIEERQNTNSTESVRKLLKINGLLLALVFALIFGGGGIRYGVANLQAKQAASTVTEVIQARREVQKYTAATKELQRLTADAPNIALMLNALAATIDATAWLDRVTVNKETIEIQGYAQNAADILYLVDELPYFSDASFKSAISPDQKSGQERFQIRATLTEKL